MFDLTPKSPHRYLDVNGRCPGCGVFFGIGQPLVGTRFPRMIAVANQHSHSKVDARAVICNGTVFVSSTMPTFPTITVSQSNVRTRAVAK